MTPIQQMLLGAGGAKKTYIDDVFSTWTYKPTGNWNHAINNGINLSGEGGMVWSKSRAHTYVHALIDTVRGKTKFIQSNVSTAETTDTNALTQFNSNGYEVGADGVNGIVNYSSTDSTKYVSWTFRKSPGFFDVVTWTGNETARTINHNLKSIPGMIMVKCTSSARNWTVWHRNTSDPATKFLVLNEPNGEAATGSAGTQNDMWNSSAPNANSFPIGVSWDVNRNNETYVAYVFAGGESSAATARSVDYDGSGDYLSIAASSDLNLDGAFTIEAWVNVDDGGWSGTRRTLFANSTGWATNHAAVSLMNSAHSNEENTIILYNNTSTIADSSPVRIEPSDGWTHIAITRDSSNKIRIFKNGIQAGSTVTSSEEFKFGHGETWIGAITMSTGSTPEVFDGKISNLRVIKGTALYTSAFKPPTEPLTNVTNTKLLCCNNSSTTGSTVTPGTITANGDPTASTDSPFADPDGLLFGDSKAEGIIKCGSYKGNGSSDGPEVYLGWEPQWLLIKNATSSSREWKMLDSMRGLPTGSGDNVLIANGTEAETGSLDNVDITPTGFKITANNAHYNENGETIIYLAIRRPDGYVGKPAEAGTDVFAMDTGNSSSTIPAMDSGFPVDFGLIRIPTTEHTWWTYARLIQGKYLLTNTTAGEASDGGGQFDSNTGFYEGSGINSTYQSWMWKRHAGFDVVAAKGTGVARKIPHSLNKPVEMIWAKKRSGSDNWVVGHKGLDGGTAPWTHYLSLNLNIAEGDSDGAWNDTAPTSTHFSVGTWNEVNGSGEDYLYLLFASVDGISKVGYYTGNGSSNGPTINLGFQPRFVLIKCTSNSSTNWKVFDTTRGIDKDLSLNTSDAQADDTDWMDLSSTGFQFVDGDGETNGNSRKYVYYAHA